MTPLDQVALINVVLEVHTGLTITVGLVSYGALPYEIKPVLFLKGDGNTRAFPTLPTLLEWVKGEYGARLLRLIDDAD